GDFLGRGQALPTGADSLQTVRLSACPTRVTTRLPNTAYARPGRADSCPGNCPRAPKLSACPGGRESQSTRLPEYPHTFHLTALAFLVRSSSNSIRPPIRSALRLAPPMPSSAQHHDARVARATPPSMSIHGCGRSFMKTPRRKKARKFPNTRLLLDLLEDRT